MRLIGILFHVTRIDAAIDGFTAEAIAMAECSVYKAHFPGHPVTPGACLIQMIRELAEKHLKQPLRVVGMRNVKFLSVIEPGAAPIFFAVRLKGQERVEAQAVITKDVTVCAKLTLILQTR